MMSESQIPDHDEEGVPGASVFTLKADFRLPATDEPEQTQQQSQQKTTLTKDKMHKSEQETTDDKAPIEDALWMESEKGTKGKQRYRVASAHRKSSGLVLAETLGAVGERLEDATKRIEAVSRRLKPKQIQTADSSATDTSIYGEQPEKENPTKRKHKPKYKIPAKTRKADTDLKRKKRNKDKRTTSSSSATDSIKKIKRKLEKTEKKLKEAEKESKSGAFRKARGGKKDKRKSSSSRDSLLSRKSRGLFRRPGRMSASHPNLSSSCLTSPSRMSSHELCVSPPALGSRLSSPPCPCSWFTLLALSCLVFVLVVALWLRSQVCRNYCH